MVTVDCNECRLVFNDPQRICISCHATAAVPAHCAFISIAIIVFQREIIPLLVFEEHKPVGPNSEMPVAKKSNLSGPGVYLPGTIIHDDKIIPVAMVFTELNFHLNALCRKSMNKSSY